LASAGAALATGIEGATTGLETTGGALLTSVGTALTDLELSIQAGLNASLGIGIAA
jgi:hypothetical protein